METAQELEKMAELHTLTHGIALQMRPRVPNGQRMLHLYHPMTFAKKKHGAAEIKTESKQCFDVVNTRNAFLLGLRPLSVNYGSPVGFNFLYHNGNMLTSDQPVEIHQQYISFSKCRGNVLMGGLGLGMAAVMMLDSGEVESVTVVEKEQDIIDLVYPQIARPGLQVIRGDIFEHLRKEATRSLPVYNSAYHDIWYRCGEGTWASYVVPLYRASQRAGISCLAAWGEYEMRAQLCPTLLARALSDPQYSKWKPYAVFLEGCERALKQKAPFSEKHLPQLKALVSLYLGRVGTPKWERTFDWGPLERPED